MSDWRYMDAIKEGLAAELRDDPRVFVAGIDVGRGGGIFGVTRGLFEEFGPDRVRDAPISETALIGMAVGAAMVGYRPVVELMFMDFIGVAFDPLLNQAAKLRYMTGGAVEIPMVVRTQTGTGRASGAQHSQSLEAVVAHIPGLCVVMPATVEDAAGLLRSAIRDPRPVVYIENRRLYGKKATRPESLPEPIPLGRATVRRFGDALTIVSWGRMVHLCLEAADDLDREGISVEVVDLRSLVPADMDTVVESVIKTSRLLVVQEAVRDFGAGAEFASRVCEAAFYHLDAPPGRLGGKSSPVPFSPALESHWVPSKESVIQEVRRLISL